MKVKVSDYIAQYLAKNDINDLFTVVGGNAMHLNDSFGHSKEVVCTYFQHEQAAAMAAEAYARVKNKIAAVCVTSGPGAGNAITGVMGGYMDSIPMLIISGQVRYNTTVRYSGLQLRTKGIQEFDIIPSVCNMTKYAEMVTDPMQIKIHLDKALFYAFNGRPGPCWLDIPLDVQGAIIESDELVGWSDSECDSTPSLDGRLILSKLHKAKRPLILVGNGVRLADAYQVFRDFADHVRIPVVTTMSSVDAMEDSCNYYVGRTGITGDRAGNFAVQNADVIFTIGCRMGYTQTGYDVETWAPNAYVIMNDIDSEELKKDNIHVDLPVCIDAKELLGQLNSEAEVYDWSNGNRWREQCILWKKSYPVVNAEQYNDNHEGHTNIYAFYEELSKVLQNGDNLVVSVGTARVAGSQAFRVKRGQRFITNPNTASMGYGVPAAIGTAIASGKKDVYLVTGEGSLQMNIQDLQTIVYNRFPIKIFVINNGGYHSIRMTQNNFFKTTLVGVGQESGDLSFPECSKIAEAYGIQYFSCNRSEMLHKTLEDIYMHMGPAICEIFVSKEQKTEPKVMSKQLEDGSFQSARLEDMAPFLTEEELKRNLLD